MRCERKDSGVAERRSQVVTLVGELNGYLDMRRGELTDVDEYKG
ncbi:MAG TPA: hypothetical protein VIW68_10175 [Candidatus Sulfotelmatobacter sp.]